MSPEQQLILTSTDGSITLRQLRPEDAQVQYDLLGGNLSHLAQFSNDPAATYGSPELLRQSIQESLTNGDRFRFAIWDDSHESSKMVRTIELTLMGEDRGSTATWVGAAHTGHGYAARAAEPLISFAFNKLGLKQLFRKIRIDNPASIRTAEKLGYKYVSTSPAKIATYVLDNPQLHD